MKVIEQFAELRLSAITSLSENRLQMMIDLDAAGDFDWDAYGELAMAYVEPNEMPAYRGQFDRFFNSNDPEMMDYLQWEDREIMCEGNSFREAFNKLGILGDLTGAYNSFIDLIDKVGY